VTAIVVTALLCATLLRCVHVLSVEWKPVACRFADALAHAPHLTDFTEKPDPMPADLIARVNAMTTDGSTGDDTMREQTMASLAEQYELHGHDWAKVRMWADQHMPDTGWQSL